MVSLLEQRDQSVDLPPIDTDGQLKTAYQGKALNVLVAEDDSVNALLIRTLLSQAGHKVTLVEDGQRALDAATEDLFDLALVDLRMPNMDGIDFTRFYRASEREGHYLPIIALTANASENIRQACFAAGMDEFLSKPVDPARLDRCLTRFGRVNSHE
ncbi:MAG: response regulator [Candidatus Sedimenticola sp. (ex Thyasira tokunagai)]